MSGQRHAPAALWPRERTLGTHCTGAWIGPRVVLETEARGIIISPLPRIEPRSPGRPARIQTLYWLSYPAYDSELCQQHINLLQNHEECFWSTRTSSWRTPFCFCIWLASVLDTDHTLEDVCWKDLGFFVVRVSVLSRRPGLLQSPFIKELDGWEHVPVSTARCAVVSALALVFPSEQFH
jgi:hypothetical protein